MLLATTAGFTSHLTQMVPSFPRQASVDASYQRAHEEKSIGKYQSVKRRDQGKVIGWETNETPDKCSGDFQRIQWQCYDGQNYYSPLLPMLTPASFSSTGWLPPSSSLPQPHNAFWPESRVPLPAFPAPSAGWEGGWGEGRDLRFLALP